MGTNYYYTEKQPCQCCEREYPSLHIGKSSGGWCFALHVDDEIKNLSDWLEKFNQDGSFITNEYGDRVTKEEMIDIITNRSIKNPNPKYAWSDNDYRINHAEKGPNGLARSLVDGRHCIGWGEGTYDYITGEFS